MGCGASRRVVGAPTLEEPLQVADTGAGPLFAGRLPPMEDVTPPGVVPEEHQVFRHLRGEGFPVESSRGSLIMKHPPRRPQRLEEALFPQTTASVRPTVQEIEEEEEEEDGVPRPK